MKKILYFASCVAFAMIMPSCAKETKIVEDTVKVQEEATDTVPYRIAEGYELKSGVKKLHTPKLGSSKAFNQYFKSNGVGATEIDFNKEYVIAAIKPDAKGQKMVFSGIEETSDDRVLMSYYMEEAESKDASTTLLIIVPDSIDGYVDVKEVF